MSSLDPRETRPAEREATEASLREGLASLRLSEAAKDGAGRPPRRWHLLLAGLVLAVFFAALLWRVLGSGPARVETVRAVPVAEASGEEVAVLSGSGYLVPAQPTIAIGSRVPGRIARYRVEEGDRVEAGQALVELEERPFRATVEQGRASLASARARLTLAESELQRARQLHRQGATSGEELDRRESEARVARASVQELEAALSRAEIDLEDTVIRAPTSGVVLETFKQPGEVAVPGGFSGSGDLLRLANLAELRAELDVNEADLTRVRLGQEARIVPDAFPEAEYAGRVVALAPQIDRQKGTREVEVRVLQPDERLLPDMSVRVVFLERIGEAGQGTAGAAVVPRGALRRGDDGGTFLWTVVDGRARRVAVAVGETLGDRVILAGGLVGGERVVVGDASLRDGQIVEAD